MVDLGEDGIVLHPAVAYPIEMYTDDRIAEFDMADHDLSARLGLPSFVMLAETI